MENHVLGNPMGIYHSVLQGCVGRQTQYQNETVINQHSQVFQKFLYLLFLFRWHYLPMNKCVCLLILCMCACVCTFLLYFRHKCVCLRSAGSDAGLGPGGHCQESCVCVWTAAPGTSVRLFVCVSA